eukprot:tig00001343_g8338.t1
MGHRRGSKNSDGGGEHAHSAPAAAEGASSEPYKPTEEEERIAKLLSGAIQIDTTSYESDTTAEEPKNAANFKKLREYLEASFPDLHRVLTREVIANHSLLFTWKGTEPEKEAVMIYAHQDVVPAPPEGWTHPPFSGAIADGFVWGRGALDMKHALICALYAVDGLAKAGHKPRRTVLIVAGHDEEVPGLARRGRGVRAALLLDEGGVVSRGVVPGVSAPVAVVGISEKGDAVLELECEGEGGHASMPQPAGPVARLAHALMRVDENPMPPVLTEPILKFIEAVSPHMPLFKRAALAVPSKAETAAAVRTSIAITTVQAGTALNVIPRVARACLNVRMLPGQSVEDAIQHVEKHTRDLGARVRVRAGRAVHEAAPVTDVAGPAYRLVEQSARAVLCDHVVVAPYTTSQATDSRHFRKVCPGGVCRFSPVDLTTEDVRRIHGVDERVSLRDLGRCARFVHEILRRADAL